MAGKASEPKLIVEEMAVKAPISKQNSRGRRLKKMTIKRSLKKKKVEKATELENFEKASIEGEDQNEGSSDDSLKLNKVNDIVMPYIRNKLGSPPRPISSII